MIFSAVRVTLSRGSLSPVELVTNQEPPGFPFCALFHLPSRSGPVHITNKYDDSVQGVDGDTVMSVEGIQEREVVLIEGMEKQKLVSTLQSYNPQSSDPVMSKLS